MSTPADDAETKRLADRYAARLNHINAYTGTAEWAPLLTRGQKIALAVGAAVALVAPALTAPGYYLFSAIGAGFVLLWVQERANYRRQRQAVDLRFEQDAARGALSRVYPDEERAHQRWGHEQAIRDATDALRRIEAAVPIDTDDDGGDR